MADTAGTAFERLVDVVARLRAPGGCPWDREQTLETLRPFVLEETYEVLEAIDGGDAREHCEELGDLLLQIVFQAQLAGEAALVSLARLRPEFHGLPPDASRLAERAARETLHELGHTCGLVPCADPRCAMSLSLSVRQVDAKAGGYCDGCAALLEDALSLIRAGHALPRAAEAP